MSLTKEQRDLREKLRQQLNHAMCVKYQYEAAKFEIEAASRIAVKSGDDALIVACSEASCAIVRACNRVDELSIALSKLDKEQ